MRTLTPFLVVSALAAPALAESLFPDPALEAAVRSYVFEKRHNDEPLTPDDVKDLSQVVARRKGIQSLEGLQHCKRLMLLDVADNDIADLEPIADLNLIQSLTLKNNRIVDISPLAGLKRLQYLELSGNQVEDISPLAGLTAMNSLYLANNEISDISAVSGMTRLWSLYLEGNQVEDVSPVKELPGLQRLALDDNQISDISSLIEMAEKDVDGKDRFARYWRVTLDGNPLPAEEVAELEAIRERPYKTESD